MCSSFFRQPYNNQSEHGFLRLSGSAPFPPVPITFSEVMSHLCTWFSGHSFITAWFPSWALPVSWLVLLCLFLVCKQQSSLFGADFRGNPQKQSYASITPAPHRTVPPPPPHVLPCTQPLLLPPEHQSSVCFWPYSFVLFIMSYKWDLWVFHLAKRI